MNVLDQFKLGGRVAIITGGAGLLGQMHAEAIAEAGGIPILVDIQGPAAQAAARRIQSVSRANCLGVRCNITRKDDVKRMLQAVLRKFKRVDILINNAANDPKVARKGSPSNESRLENFPVATWEKDIAVGLTGALFCSQIIGSHMAVRGHGVILNISSDLGVIAPDQRLYQQPGIPCDTQPVKPVTYSVIKTGILGLTRYLATYWSDRGIRVNAICPGGVEAGQPQGFKKRISARIPLGRMARRDEYKAAVVFLASDASSYMTGATLVMDGGRSIW